MFSQSSKSARYPDYSTGVSIRAQQPAQATLYSGDLRRPWKSVYGFPMAAAWLAAGEELLLTCREDEVFDYLARLNNLLESPASLNRAFDWLVHHYEATEQKFKRLLQRRQQSVSTDEIEDILAEVEEILSGPPAQTVADRLACLLSPNEPTMEIAGVGKMLIRLRRVLAGLEDFKDCGFTVAVLDRQRQPLRPNLEARRHDLISVEGQLSRIPAGFALPIQYHLTLWIYRLARSNAGRSVGWN